MFFIENEGQAVDMSTSAGMPAQPGCLSRMRQNSSRFFSERNKLNSAKGKAILIFRL